MSRSRAHLAITIILGSIIFRITVSSDRLGWVLTGEAFKYIQPPYVRAQGYPRLSFDNTGISVAVAGTLIDTILRSTGDLNDEVFGDSTLAVDYAQAAYVRPM